LDTSIGPYPSPMLAPLGNKALVRDLVTQIAPPDERL
jgi:hypothetical protein